MKVVMVDTYDEMSEVSASIIIEELQANPKLVLGLATGSTPLGTYKNLIEAYNNGIVSFKDVITYNLDEYIGLEPTHEQSYRYFMQDNLFKDIDVNQENIHFASGLGDMDENVKKYDADLAKNKIDVQVLGIGSNGHIAFNEPGTSFDSTTHVIELSEQTKEDNKRFFNDDEVVPSHAITMGIKDIMSAKKIILIINGKNKAETVKELLEGYRTEDFPASILMDHDDVTLIIDKEAASLVK